MPISSRHVTAILDSFRSDSPRRKTTRSYLPAPQRNALLQQTKILLNVHYSDLRIFRMAPSADRYGESLLFDYRDLRRLRAACPRQTLRDGESRRPNDLL